MCQYLPTQYSQFIHLSRYSRWLNDEKRRETWKETVSRYFDFFEEHLKERCDYDVTSKTRQELETAILNLEVMPSMRCVMAAGPALKRDELAGFNCSYLAIDNIKAFDEILYILMLGCGVGFSVERQYITKLPEIPEEIYSTDTTIIVSDSKLGWAKAYKELISLLYSGQLPKWDMSRVRPAGTPLKIFGGRASGPEPLDKLFQSTVNIFQQAKGRKLQSIECHDIVCFIGQAIVVGGVRRSATISLSNVSDDRMRASKSGQWWLMDPQRALANNSACYTEKPDIGIFMGEWKALYESKSGERGIINRRALEKQAAKNGRREVNKHYGINPCGEILLKNKQNCNLSEAIIRPIDTLATLKEKVRLATILGTWQSTLDSYKYVSKKWEENNKEERLLGVSLSGIMDNKLTNTNNIKLKETLTELKNTVIITNKEWANKLNITQSVATTTCKPSGTISQLVNCSSGIHPRHSEYYIRTVRADTNDPLCKLMKEMKFPNEPDNLNKETVTIFSFPMKSPKNSIHRKDITAINHLELWKTYKNYWCEHNVSITVSIKENEWLDVGAYVYKNFDEISGVAFLPYSDFSYDQAPYTECTKEDYDDLVKKMPGNVDWSKLKDYEEKDHTVSSQTYACSAGSCDIVDLV